MEKASDLSVSKSNSSVLDIAYMCERHNERAYFLCNEEKCTLPILICNQCSEEDHCHDTTSVKKVEKLLAENDKAYDSDSITNTIRGFYHDMRESICKALEEDEKTFTEYICNKKDATIDPQVRDGIKLIRERQFSKLTSTILRQTMEHIKHSPSDNNVHHEIEAHIEGKRAILNRFRLELQGNKLNQLPRWQFVMPDGRKVRDIERNVYRINQDCNLIGNRTLDQRVHRWRIVFTSLEAVGCIGFGLASLDTLSMTDVSIGSVLSCLCCNGPWSGYSFDIKDNVKMKDKLNAKQNVITFQLNRNKGMVFLFDPQGKLHGEKRLDSMRNTNLVPIIKRGGSAKVEFRVEHLLG